MVGSKELLPTNSLMEVISLKNTPIFTEINLLLIRQNTIPYGQGHLDKTQFHMVKGIINAFDHMELCFVINLTKDGNWAITWPPIFATGSGYVSFASTYLLPAKKVNF